MTSIPRLGPVLVGVALAACGARPDATPDADEPEMVMTVSTDRERYGSGDPIRVTIQARNTSPDPITLSFTSGQRYDIAIRAEGGTDHWRWSADRMFAQVLGEERVPAGAAVEHSETFDGALAPGRYVVLGTIPVAGGGLEARARFIVEPQP